ETRKKGSLRTLDTHPAQARLSLGEREIVARVEKRPCPLRSSKDEHRAEELEECRKSHPPYCGLFQPGHVRELQVGNRSERVDRTHSWQAIDRDGVARPERVGRAHS